jgi:DNA polymerase-3 subunit epsilon
VIGWWDGNVTVFDLETDSADPTDARIITAYVGEIRAERGGLPGQHWMAMPERDIPEEASAVHGISTERARAEGQPRELVVGQIATALARGSDGPDGSWGKVPVCGHNIAYDLTVLDRELRRLKLGRLVVDHFADMDVSSSSVLVKLRGEPIGAFYCIDTMVLDKAIDPYRPGPRDPKTGEKLGGRNRLTAVAEHYGVPIRGDAHAADADALASGRIAWAIARRCAMAAEWKAERGKPFAEVDPTVGREISSLYRTRKVPAEVLETLARVGTLSLPELHEWQRRMAPEQAASFRQYCIDNPAYVKEKGIDIGGIDGSWPLRSLTDVGKSETVAAVSGDVL